MNATKDAIRKTFAQTGILFTLVILFDQFVKYYVKTHFYIGEEIKIMGDWFRIHFTENYGMAFGFEFGGKGGKIVLTLFRVAAVVFIGWYLARLIRSGAHKGYVISWTLIMAGAAGNIIDSIFYGIWFGYDDPFHGRVVDMLYFPLIHTTIPDWFPFWKNEDFEFFRPVFNIADAAISIGFILILLFQKTFFEHEYQMNQAAEPTVEESSENTIDNHPASE